MCIRMLKRDLKLRFVYVSIQSLDAECCWSESLTALTT